MKLDRVADVVAGVPYLTPHQGRLLYDHVRRTKPLRVLELGTAHGVSTAYIAAALDENGAGVVTTVDSRNASFTNPAPEELIERAGLSANVVFDRRFSTYTWFLKDQLAGEPYDFVFLDGQKNWTTDGLAVLLIERLLAEGGWLLIDDLDWTYAAAGEFSDGIAVAELSEPERSEPHLTAVFELLVMQHPSFSSFRIQDGWWGWARKDATSRRTLSVEVTRSWGSYAVGAGRTVIRRMKART